MTDIVEKPKPYQIADSLLEMAQDVEIGHADRLGVPTASFLRESADCISRQNDEIERLRGVEQDAVEWVEERTKRLRAEVERLRAALQPFATACDSYDDEPPARVIASKSGAILSVCDLRAAKAALE